MKDWDTAKETAAQLKKKDIIHLLLMQTLFVYMETALRIRG